MVGHHSHRINPIEEYNGKYIVYSLANFAFAGNTKPSDMSTFIFQIKFRVKDGEVTTPDGFIIIPARISSNTSYNDFIITPYTKRESIDSVVSLCSKRTANIFLKIPCHVRLPAFRGKNKEDKPYAAYDRETRHAARVPAG